VAPHQLLGYELARTGLISTELLKLGLERQSAIGGRLGSHLIELGYLAEDLVSQALGRQLGVPAALRAEFEQIDPNLLRLLPPRAAAMYRAVPLGHAPGPSHQIRVAMMDPQNLLAVDELGTILGRRVAPVVAPEVTVLGMLERFYGFRREPRPAWAAAEQSVAPARPPVGLGGTWVMTPESKPTGSKSDLDLRATLPSRLSPSHARARAPAVPITAAATIAIEPTAPVHAATIGLDAMLGRLAQATERDGIGRVLVDFSAPIFGCVLLLVVKDGLGLGWLGFAPEVAPELIESIVVPLSAPSAFRIAYTEQRVFRGPPPAHGEMIHTRLCRLLRSALPKEVMVAPVALGEERARTSLRCHRSGVSASDPSPSNQALELRPKKHRVPGSDPGESLEIRGPRPKRNLEFPIASTDARY
jgi:hypothetical protein